MSSFAPAPVPAPTATRRGKRMLILRGAPLPPNCLKCGRPAEVPWRHKYYWHHPALYIMIFFPGLLIYAIVALIIRKKMELNVPLCNEHHSERKRNRLLAILLLLGAIPGGLLVNNLSSEMGGWIAGFAMFFASIVFYILSQGPIRPEKINQEGGLFMGAHKDFLALLPEHPPGPMLP